MSSASATRADDSQVVAALLTRLLGEGISPDARRRLHEVRAQIVHADTGVSEAARAWMCADWLVRDHLPAWLELAGLGRRARALRKLAPLTDGQRASAAASALTAARQAAAEAAGRDAAWEATWADRWQAASSASRDAAWLAAGPAWEAARDGARFVDWGPAREAAGDAAWDAARAASWDAAWEAADDDPREAASSALVPTAAALDLSAVELVARLLDPSSRQGAA